MGPIWSLWNTSNEPRATVPNQTDPGPAFISNTRARKPLGVGRTTLQRWRESGKLPYRKVGQLVFYRVADVNALIEGSGIRRAA